MRRLTPYILSATLLVISSASLLGQNAQSSNSEALLWVLMAVILGMTTVCIGLALTILALLAKVREKSTSSETESVKAVYVEQEDFWQKFKKKLTAAVPVTREAEIDMGHDYDGIRELDNKLPPWWVYGFYLTIVIGVFYLFYYHVLNDWSSEQEFRMEMAEADKIKEAYLARVANLVNEESVEVLQEQSELIAGKAIYKANCVACHGNQGEGGIGPNLADAYWIHGGGIKNVFKTVKYGVPEKGMIPWQAQLKPIEMQQVSSYILSMEGSNPPNAKEPQGEIWTPEANTADSVEVISMN